MGLGGSAAGVSPCCPTRLSKGSHSNATPRPYVVGARRAIAFTVCLATSTRGVCCVRKRIRGSPSLIPCAGGRGWRWLYAAYRQDIGPAPASMRVPEDRVTKIAARRTVQLASDVRYMLLCPGREPDRDIVYVGEMDAEHNPDGYGILFRPGVFAPHAIANAEPAHQRSTGEGDNNRRDNGANDQEIQDNGDRHRNDRYGSGGCDSDHHGSDRVPKPGRTTCSDVCTRLYCADGDGVASVVAFFKGHDSIAEHASNMQPGKKVLLATLAGEMVQDRHAPGTSTHVSTGDRIEGVWLNGHFQSGTVQFYDDRRKCYYEGAIRDGVYHGTGTLTRHNGEIYAGQWRGGFYCAAASAGYSTENRDAATHPLL